MPITTNDACRLERELPLYIPLDGDELEAELRIRVVERDPTDAQAPPCGREPTAREMEDIAYALLFRCYNFASLAELPPHDGDSLPPEPAPAG